MKKAFQTFLFLLAVTGFNSCKSILLRTSGVSKPKFETKESIMTYLSKNAFDTVNGVFTAKDSTGFFQLITLIGGLPGVDFFNQKGELLEYSATGDCTSKAEKFATGLTPGALFIIDSSYQFSDVKEKVIRIGGENDLSLDNPDFIVLLYWSKFLGKMNKGVMKIIKSLRDNKKISARIYLINMDFQSTWGMKLIPEVSLK